MKTRENGILRDMTPEEVAEYYKSIEISNEEQIEMLKQNLADTDYQAIKYAEGDLTNEEFEPIRLQRKAWRDEINRLEKENE